MEEKKFYSEFKSLPVKAQEQVLTFMDYLQKLNESGNKKFNTKRSIATKKFVGIWKDRDDMINGSEWKKKLRRKEWKELGS